MSKENKYKIIETDVSADSDLETTVQAGAVKFSESGEKLVWDDKFVEKVSPLDARDLTATVHRRSVQKAMLDIFSKEDHGNQKIRTLGIILFIISAFIAIGAFIYVAGNSNESVDINDGLSTESDADITKNINKN